MSNISDIEESVIATTDAIQNYVTAQIKASSNDYELLNDVNTTTAAQCGMYSSSARSSIESLERITFKYIEIEPHLKSLDTLESNITRLEEIVVALDLYSVQLEERFLQNE